MPWRVGPRRRGLHSRCRTIDLRKSLTPFAALAVLAGALAGATPTATASAPRITHFTLSNGLEVVVIPDHRAPVVTHMVWYKVGSADETAGKSGLAHFLEHLMFKGTDEEPVRTLLPGRRDHRRPGERLHLGRLHRLFPARAARPAQGHDGVRGRPHDRADAHRRRGAARAQRGAGRAEYAGRQQSGRAAGRADGRRALSQPSLWPAGDRLAARDRAARPRSRARILPALLHAQQRHSRRGRRRDADEIRTLAEETYGKVPRVADIKPRLRPQEPAQQAAAHGDAGRSARHPAEP